MGEKLYTYAGFWKRFLAYIIDSIILNIIMGIIFIPVFLIFGLSFFQEYGDPSNFNYNSVSYTQNLNDVGEVALVSAVILFVLIAVIGSIIISWLYFALMEASSKKATLGKMALGLIVTDVNGVRLSFGRASGRYFGKILSGLILNIGFIMAAFTEKKQALHDILAGTLVLEVKSKSYYE
ncbi:MAG TPA: RDD family protein [Melioribacteraceae bacterium]|nr:RDD family protein [Melioribacteraceae bacterium]